MPMSDNTVASKLNRLLQKSRQAYRIYSAMSKSAKNEGNLYSELQANEWLKANADLVKQLSLLIDERSCKNLSQRLNRIRFNLEEEYLKAESNLESEQQDLVACSKRGDFVRCAQLSTSLISKKGFIQATRAAAHELQLICGSDNSTFKKNAAFGADSSQDLSANSISATKGSNISAFPNAFVRTAELSGALEDETKHNDKNSESFGKVIQLRR